MFFSLQMGNRRKKRTGTQEDIELQTESWFSFCLLCSSLETPALPAAKLQRFHPHVWSTLQSLSYVSTPRTMFSKTGKTGKAGKTCQTVQNRPSQICTGLSPTSLTLSSLSIGNLFLSTLFLYHVFSPSNSNLPIRFPSNVQSSNPPPRDRTYLYPTSF